MRRRVSLPKPAPRVFLVQLGQILAGTRNPNRTPSYARQVRRAFRRRHDVVGRQRILGVGQRDFDRLGAGGLQHVHAASPQRHDFLGRPVDAVLLRNADPHAPDVGIACRGGEVRNRQRRRGRILRIVARHGLQHQRGVFDGAGERTRLVERTREGHDTPARAAAVGRLQADDTAEGSRLPDRAAGIGSRAAGHHVGCHRRGRAARRAAGTSLRLSPLRFHGFSTPPKWLVMFEEPMANSSRLVLPTITAPDFHRFAVTVLSYGGTNPLRWRKRQLSGRLRCRTGPLMASGTPSSRPASPRARRASEAFAISPCLVRRLGDEGVQRPMLVELPEVGRPPPRRHCLLLRECRRKLGDGEIGQGSHRLLHHFRHGEEAAGIPVRRIDVDRPTRPFARTLAATPPP